MKDKKHKALDSLGLWATVANEIIEIHDYSSSTKGPQLVINRKDLMELNKLLDIKACECPPSDIPTDIFAYDRPVDTFVPEPQPKRIIKSDWPMAGLFEAITKIFSNK